jgi:hypothetical protein
MVIDLADAFAWAADIVSPRGHGKAFLVDSDRVLGCQLAGRVPDAGGMEDTVCGDGVFVVRARLLTSQRGTGGGQHCQPAAAGRVVGMKSAVVGRGWRLASGSRVGQAVALSSRRSLTSNSESRSF